MARGRRPLSSVQVTMRIQPDILGLDAALTTLDQLASPQLIGQLLRQAVAETLLTAFRMRFLDNFEKVLDPHVAGGTTATAASEGTIAAKQELTKAYAAATAAEISGDRAAQVLAQTRVRRAQRRLIQHTERVSGPSSLSTGQFRVRALEVLRALTDASLLEVHTTDDGVLLGIGKLAELENIQTPSATPQLTGHPTASSMTTLWRQLEFGTGVYARTAGGPRSPKGWWYSPHPGTGLRLMGAQGVHAVFDAATGLPYHRDAVEFEEVFAGLLGRALAGR